MAECEHDVAVAGSVVRLSGSSPVEGSAMTRFLPPLSWRVGLRFNETKKKTAGKNTTKGPPPKVN